MGKWEKEKLGSVCDFQNGFAFKSSLYKKEGLPIVRITNIQDNAIDTNNIVYFEEKEYNRSLNDYKIYPGDLLIAMSGATTGKIGINNTNEIFYLNQRVGKFKPKDVLNKLFLYYFLSTKVEESLRISEGAAQPNLSSAQIKNFEIPLPPLSEQNRIVSKLDSIFSEIDASLVLIDQNIAQAEALKLSVLDDEINNNEFELVPFLEYITERKDKLKPEPETTYNIIGLENIESYSGKLIDFRPMKGGQSISNKSVFKKGDVLYSKLRPYLNKVFVAEFDGIATTEILPFIVNQEKFLNSFVGYFLRSESIVQLINLSCSGARMPRVKTTFWKTLKIPTPSLEIQQKIVQKLNVLTHEIEALITDYTLKRKNLEALKSSLLDSAFKGEL